MLRLDWINNLRKGLMGNFGKSKSVKRRIAKRSQTASERLEVRTLLAAFTGGNIVVERINGTTNAATAVFLDEYTPSGVLVQSIAAPTSDNGPHQTLTDSGSASSNGYLTRSVDGQYLIVSGYDATVGTASVAGSDPATINRVIGRVGADGVFDTTTTFSDGGLNNFRSVASLDGSSFYMGTGAGSVRYTTFGATGASTQIGETVTNVRMVTIQQDQSGANQLYTSSGSGTTRLATVGTGLPTTSGQAITNLNGISSATVSSPYGYFFADLDGNVGVDTLYVADDDAGGGIRKFSLVAGSWTLNNVIGANTDDYRGLTGLVSGSTVTLYATRQGASPGVVALTDTAGYNASNNGTANLIVSLPAGVVFRGVALTPEGSSASPGVTISQSGGSTEISEAGTTDTYVVSLDTVPEGAVEITVTADSQTQVSLDGVNFGSSAILTFTDDAPQTVTVRAIDDLSAEGTHTGTITHAVTATADATNYPLTTVIESVTASVTDNDTPGVTITESDGSTNVAEGGQTDTYTIGLETIPSSEVQITVAGDADAEVSTDGVTYSAFVVLSFTTLTAQTVYVRAVDDALEENAHTGTITHDITSSSDANYPVSLVIPDLVANISDNDLTPAVGLYINEVLFNPPGTDGPNEYIEIRGTANYVIPGGVYLVGIEGDTTGAGDVQTIFGLGGLNIGSNGYLVVRQNGNTYTVDGLATSVVGTGTGFSGAADFSADAGTDIENSSVTFILMQTSTAPTLANDIDGDNDGVADGPVFSGWSVLDSIAVLDNASDAAFSDVVYSTAATFVGSTGKDVVLTSATANYVARRGVSTGNTSSDWFGGGVEGTAPNWNLITGDAYPASFDGESLDHIGSENPGDSQSPGVTVSQSDGSTEISEAGTTDTYTISLDTVPEGAVEVTVTADSQTEVSVDGVNFSSSATLTFTDNTPQTITIRAIDDLSAEGIHTGTITHAVTATADAANYPLTTVIESVTANVTDNDTPGVTITESDGSTNVAEGGQTDTYTIGLETIPSSEVQITVAGDADVEVSTDGVTYSASVVLSFTTLTAQTVYVRAVDDPLEENAHTGTITHDITSSSDANYPVSLVIPDLVANISDNDLTPAVGLYVNEVLFNPPGTDGPNEYIEIRGTANYVIPGGVYLVGIEGDTTGAGDVQTIFGLGGLTIGSNGYLVIRQNGNTYTVDGSATSIVGTGTGFSGAANFSADAGTDIENSSVTFILMQSLAAPTLSDDIDADNNGVADGTVVSNWSILDSIAVLDNANDAAFSDVVYSTAATFVGSTGKDVVLTSATANYVARRGVSTGNTSADWFGGGLEGTAPNWNLVTGDAYPASFDGELLDHIGSENPAGNQAPSDVVLENVTAELPEYTYTLSPVKVADISVTDDGRGTNLLSLSGADDAFFELVGSELFLKKGTVLDFENKSTYTVTVNVDDPSVGTTPDASVDYTLTLTDVVESAAPVIGAFETPVAPVSYRENSLPVRLDSNATVTDVDSTDFKGGRLIVSLITNQETDDRISIVHQGTLAGQIGVSGNVVSYGGVAIGTFTGGTSGDAPFVLTFEQGSSRLAVQQALRYLAFSSVSENPSTATRTVQVQLTDGLGGDSVPVTKSILVTVVNDRPVLANLAGGLAYAENGAPILIGPESTATDADSANFELGKLSVRVSANQQTTDRISIRNEGTGAGQIGTSPNAIDALLVDVSYGGTIIGTYPVRTTYSLVVTLNASSTAEAVTALLRNIQFSNISDAVNSSTRTISATLSDGDGGTSLAITTTVDVTGSNDAPVIGGFEPGVTYKEDAMNFLIDANATVIDGDLLNFDGGVLTVDLPANGHVDDRLGIRNQGLELGRIGVSGNQITYGVRVNGVVETVVIGTLTGGTSGADPLVVSFNSSATGSAVQAVVRNLTFGNVSQEPSTLTRTVRIQLTDGDGGTATPVTKSIDVTSVNDAAVIGGFEGESTYNVGGSPVIVDDNATVTDVDTSAFSGGVLKVSLTTNRQSTDRLSILSVGTGVDEISVSGNEVFYEGTLIGTFAGTTTLTVNLNSSATQAAVQKLLRSVTFHSLSATPSLLTRTVTVSLADGEGAVSLLRSKSILLS